MVLKGFLTTVSLVIQLVDLNMFLTVSIFLCHLFSLWLIKNKQQLALKMHHFDMIKVMFSPYNKLGKKFEKSNFLDKNI